MRVDRTVLIKTIDPSSVYASVSFRSRSWAAGRAVVACVLAAHETFAGATNKFCRGLSAGYKDSGTGTQEIGTSVSSGCKNLFLLPTAHRGMYIVAGEKSRGDSILDNRTMATTTTLCDHSRTNCVCVRALEGESECNRVLVYTAWHRDTST